jgi:hypothetical protein
MDQSPSWEANTSRLVEKSPSNFMKPRGSLPHLQKSATCSYPKPDQSSPRLPIPILDKFMLIDNIKIELKYNWGYEGSYARYVQLISK